MTNKTDIAIIGAGIAGAGLAAMIAEHAAVTLIEMEQQPGYHTTGRSAAFYAETYGGPAIQPLTSASLQYFLSPPAIMSDRPLVSPRGALHLAEESTLEQLHDMDRLFSATDVALQTVDRAEIEKLVPFAGKQWVSGRYEPGCRDLDVTAIHHGFLRMAVRAGSKILCNAPLKSAERAGGYWHLDTAAGRVQASIVVIAAGAWADHVAQILHVKPLSIKAFRRTMLQAQVNPSFNRDGPLVLDVAGRFYFRPDAQGVWITPHDETPDIASDVQPNEIDVALGIERFEQAGDWRVSRLTRRWAGLRSFTPDRLPVYGFDKADNGVFWCAGQGGFGIQTSPAASLLAAGLILDRPLADDIAHIDPLIYSPDRLND